MRQGKPQPGFRLPYKDDDGRVKRVLLSEVCRGRHVVRAEPVCRLRAYACQSSVAAFFQLEKLRSTGSGEPQAPVRRK